MRRHRGPGFDVAELAACPAFAGFGRRELGRLAADAIARTYRPGETVVEQGDRAGAFFVVADGRATVRVDDVPRRELGPGDWFGELSLVRDAPRSATVVAATELRCVVFPVWDVRALVQQHASVATALGERVGRYLADDHVASRR